MSEKFDELLCDFERATSDYAHTMSPADWKVKAKNEAALVEYVTGLEEKLFFCGHATEPSDAQLSDEASGWSPQYQSVINLRRLCTRHEKEIEALEAENARLREVPAIQRLDESLRVIFALVNKLGGEVSLTYDELKGIEGMNLTTRNDDAEMVFVLKVSSRR